MASLFGGLRVVEIGQGMAVPMAGGIMADHGAEVIKVEPPGGDWARSLPGFHTWNRGKHSLVLDLGTDAGRDVARALARSADVVIESLPPGRAEELGLDGASLEELCPHLVHCSVSGFGPLPAFAHLPADEGIVAAALGRMLGTDALSGAVVPDAAERPVYQAAPVAAFGAAMLALQAVAAGLFDRARTGRGRRVETSLFDGASAASMRLAFERDGDGLRPRAEEHDLVYQGILLTFLTARCADGRYVQMCARQDHHFRNWMTVLGLDDVLAEERYRHAPLGIRSRDDLEELRQRIVERMATRTQAEWMEAFVASDVGADPFLTPAEFLRHPQMTLNGRVAVVDDPQRGSITQVGPLVAMSETPARIQDPAPQLGRDRIGSGRHRGRQVPRGWPGPRSRPGPVDRTIARGRLGWPATMERPAAPGDPRPLPLAGVTILEVASFLAGPLGPTLLAELGARVIKVEPLAGDPFRRVGLEAAHLAAGKESIALDLTHPDAAHVLARLVRQADVVVHNMRPAAAERLGLGYEDLRRLKPTLVHVAATAYGSGGPDAGRAAFHSTPHALCGGGFLQAGRGNPPVDDSYPDPCAGMAVAAAVAMGLLARERWGRGQRLETSMLATAGYVHSDALVQYAGRPASRFPDPEQHGPCALYRLYECRRGWLFLAAPRARAWPGLVAALGAVEWESDPRFATAEARRSHDEELADAIGHHLRTRSAAEWAAILPERGVAAAVADGLRFEEVLVHHGLVHPVEHPELGSYWGLPPRVRVPGADAPRRTPCGVGEHTDALLTELGYEAAVRRDLAARGVVALGGGDRVAEEVAS